MRKRSRRNHSAVFKAKVALAAVPLKDLHAKIGQQALEIDFLAGALGRPPGPSAKRCSTQRTS